jgi:hypothetical protein
VPVIGLNTETPNQCCRNPTWPTVEQTNSYPTVEGIVFYGSKVQDLTSFLTFVLETNV